MKQVYGLLGGRKLVALMFANGFAVLIAMAAPNIPPEVLDKLLNFMAVTNASYMLGNGIVAIGKGINGKMGGPE